MGRALSCSRSSETALREGGEEVFPTGRVEESGGLAAQAGGPAELGPSGDPGRTLPETQGEL